MSSYYDESELIKMLASDSEYAFKVLFNQHRKRVYKYALRYLRLEEVAEEVVQDVFMKLWIHRQTLHSRGPIEAWLYTVTKNDSLSRIRKGLREPKMEELSVTHEIADNSTQDKIKEADYNNIMKEALRRLSEKQLTVYTLARQDNLSYLQIAEYLNISPLTVKTHMARALCFLRTFLGTQRIYSN